MGKDSGSSSSSSSSSSDNDKKKKHHRHHGKEHRLHKHRHHKSVELHRDKEPNLADQPELETSFVEVQSTEPVFAPAAVDLPPPPPVIDEKPVDTIIEPATTTHVHTAQYVLPDEKYKPKHHYKHPHHHHHHHHKHHEPVEPPQVEYFTTDSHFKVFHFKEPKTPKPKPVLRAVEERTVTVVAAQNQLSGRWMLFRVLAIIWAVILIAWGILLPISVIISSEVIKRQWILPFHIVILALGIAYFLYLFLVILRRFPRLRHRKKRDPTHPEKDYIYDEDGTKVPAPDYDGGPNNFINTENQMLGSDKSLLPATPLGHWESSFAESALRIGIIVFGIGSLVYDIIHLGQYIGMVTGCSWADSGWVAICFLLVFILHIVFVILQTIFLAFYGNASINKHVVGNMLGLMHVFAVNVCFWALILVEEYRRRMAKVKGLESPPTKCEASQVMLPVIDKAGFYFFSFAVEYSLVCAVCLWSVFRNIAYHRIYGFVLSTRQESSSGRIPFTCSGYIGLIFGIILLILTIAVIVVFNVLRVPNKMEVTLTNFVFEVLIVAILIIITLSALDKLKCLTFFDCQGFRLEFALYFTTIFVLLFFDVFTFLGALYSKLVWEAVMVCLRGAFSLIQAIIQLCANFEGLRRYTSNTYYQLAKPGQHQVIFLIFANICIWGLYTFDLWQIYLDSASFGFTFFNPKLWVAAMYLCLPIVMLFRFHSAASWFQVWENAYHIYRSPKQE